ncbi:hypothetical protein KEM48_011361 [Puccinia striiformis f. sp. tritici PST-130]|nr:hypothetical protein KEM48_011361 [Puccinia striiformis f. sp. tritici PST-130]
MEVDFEDLVTKQIDPNDPNQTRTQAEHAALLTSLDRATRSRQLAVPTNEVAIVGSEELLVARRSIADFSLANARKRITRQKLETHLPLSKIMATRKAVYAELKTYTNLGSQVGDERPISIVRFSPNLVY